MRSSVRALHRRSTTASRLAAATLLFGVPLLWASPAHADRVDTVTFRGGCGLLGVGASSTPDVTELSVPAGSDLAFANRLGQAAVLRMNGAAAGQVDAGDSAAVRFYHGPATVTMEISCQLGQPTGAITVEVVPTAASGSSPTSLSPLPLSSAGLTGDDPSLTSLAPTGSGSPAGTSEQKSAQAEASPSASAWGGSPPAGPRQDPALGSGPTPPGAGKPTDRWALGPPAAPARGGIPLAGASVDGSATVVDDESEFASKPLLRATEPAPDDRPIGLLALIAMVCVVGVSAGAVRAIIAQRANRAEWA